MNPKLQKDNLLDLIFIFTKCTSLPMVKFVTLPFQVMTWRISSKTPCHGSWFRTIAWRRFRTMRCFWRLGERWKGASLERKDGHKMTASSFHRSEYWKDHCKLYDVFQIVCLGRLGSLPNMIFWWKRLLEEIWQSSSCSGNSVFCWHELIEYPLLWWFPNLII